MKTYEEVRNILSAIEPEEEMYLHLSPEDLPHLQRMLHEVEPWRAARAIHAASRLGTISAHAMVSGAAKDPRREVRGAVAMAAQWLDPSEANVTLRLLLDDKDLSIQKLAIKSVNRKSSPEVLAKLKALSSATSNQLLKAIASKQLESVKVISN
jgi:hypothetical protein